jgi:formate dehydrogenase
MNSYLNENPGLHRRERSNAVEVNPADAQRLGLVDGEAVVVLSATNEVETTVVVSDAVREGVASMEQGWGSRIYDPHGQAPPDAYGANRNLLVGNGHTDPLSQTAGLNDTYVGIRRLVPKAVFVRPYQPSAPVERD